MQMKIKEKMIAVVMAFAMMFTFIFAGESSEVIAAAKTKALEINVDFARNAASGDDSGIYVKSLISNKDRTVVIVSHSIETLKQLCDTVMWMHEGQIKRIGDPNEVLDEYVAFMEKG